MKKTAFMVLISALFMIGCGGGSESTSTTPAAPTTPSTTNASTTNASTTLSLNLYGTSVSTDCNYTYYDTVTLTGSNATFELINCDIGDLIFHADDSTLRVMYVGVINFDHNGTGNILEASQADLDTIDDPTLQEIAIIY